MARLDRRRPRRVLLMRADARRVHHRARPAARLHGTISVTRVIHLTQDTGAPHLGHSLPFGTVRTGPSISVGFCLSWPRPGALCFVGAECVTGKFLDRNARSLRQFECVDQPLNLPFLDPHVHGLPTHAAELGDRRGSAGQLDRRRDHVRSIRSFATRRS